MVTSWSNFDDLLMPALDRAVSFPQMNNITLSISDDLNLNMLGIPHVPLDKAAAISKGCKGFAGCGFEKGH